MSRSNRLGCLWIERASSSLIGFLIAWRIPVKWTVAMIVLMELGVAYMIRDNLLLNILMLIHPFESIKHWQMNGR